MSAESPILGIDLGTTYSLVGALQGGRPVLLPNPLGEVLTPSAVAVWDGEILVGAAARDVAVLEPELAALSFKRDMGTERRFSLAEHTFTAPELSALVLASLVRDTRQALGTEARRAVITVPAYFDDLQRQATRDAGRIAGLDVVRLLNEPTAAAIAYGLHHLGREARLAVLDLGGGTFDVTLMEIMEGVIEIRSSAGDTRLGGDDFTAALVTALSARVADDLGAAPAGDRRTAARLQAAAETAKRRLSRADRAELALPALLVDDGREVDFATSLERHGAEELWRPLLARMRTPVQRALRDGGITGPEIDEVILVGGASRIPAVGRLAAEIFGRLPMRNVAVDEVVAQGAALQAALHAGDRALDDLVVTDIAPFTLGVETADRMAGRLVTGLFSPIIERGTVIPASRVRPYSTMSALQRQVRIDVYQGEHPLCRDNRHIGTLVVDDLPARPGGETLPFEIRFTYDLNGLLEVEMTVPGTGRREYLVIQNSPQRLTREQVQAARAAMDRLKFHPREALPNTSALARAGAAYEELRGAAREELGQAIHALHAALDLQDDTVIQPAREQLLALLDQLR